MALQLQQICLLASQIAKGGGTTFGSGMTPIAGQFLNVVLEDLKLNRNLKVNRVNQILVVSAGSFGPFNLESDYLRTYDMFYPLPASGGGTSTGIPMMMNPMTLEQWDAEFKDPSVANYPMWYATDLSTQAQTNSGTAGQLFIYPQTSGSINITHRYMKNQPDYAAPEANSSPAWFAFTDYLIKATAARMMGVTGDDRSSVWMQEAEVMLRPYLIMEGDEQETVRGIKLDPQKFHNWKQLKLTKSAPIP